MTAAIVEASLALQASLVLEDGRRWGDVASESQWRAAQAVLNPFSPTPYHYWTRPRGGSKTTDLAGFALPIKILQAPAGARLYAAAADREQAGLLVDAIEGFARRTPALQDLLDISAFSVVVRASGVKLTVLAADAPGAWGLRPYMLIIDELAQWPKTPSALEFFEALRTAAGKVNGRMVILTTAGNPTHWAFKVLEHARRDPLWTTDEVPGPVPWIAPERLEEQRRALPESAYRRLHLNEWIESEDRLTTLEDLRACVSLDGPQPPRPGTTYVIGLDIGIKHDRTAAAVCHAELIGSMDDPEGMWVVVDRIETWQGRPDADVSLSHVRDWVGRTARQYEYAKVVMDPYQGIGLAQDLRHAGLRVEEFTFSSASTGYLAATLHQLLRSRRLALPDDERLLEELARVRLRETSPGVLRLDHDAGEHDDQAIAVALAAQDLLKHPPWAGPRLRWLS